MTTAASMKSRMSCGAAVILCLLFASAALIIVPQFMKAFEDFDTELPALTLFIIQWRYVLAGMFILFAALLVVKEIALRDRRNITLLINLAFLVFLTLSLVLASLGVFLPLVKMMESLE